MDFTSTQNWTSASDLNSKEVVSFDFDSNLQKIEVVFRCKSQCMYACYPPRPVPDSVWKEIYGIENGRIALLKVIPGKHTPGEFVEESIEFPE